MDSAFISLPSLTNTQMLSTRISYGSKAKERRLLKKVGFTVLFLLWSFYTGTSEVRAAQPVHYWSCSYYGYYPYTDGSYQGAIACADNWVENGWKQCPSCRNSYSWLAQFVSALA